MRWLKGLWNRWKSRDRRVAPTNRLVGFVVAGGIFVFIVPQTWIPSYSAVTLCLLGVLLVIALVDLAVLYRHNIPSVQRIVTATPQIGVPWTIEYHISAPASWTARETAHIKLSDTYPLVFSVAGVVHRVNTASGVKLAQTLLPRKRGEEFLGDVDVEWRSPWRLWRRLSRTRLVERVRVLPDVTTWRQEVEALQRTLLTTGQHMKRVGSGHSEFHYISEYSPEDDPRTINWAATARKSRIMKNVYQPERGQQLIVAIDASRYMGVRLPDGKTRLDYAIDCALALAYSALAVGDSVGLVVFASDVMYRVNPARTTTHFSELVNLLTAVQPQPVQGGYDRLFASLSGKFHRRGQLIIFSELEGIKTDAGFLKVVQSFRKRHEALFVTLKDVDAEEVTGQVPKSDKNVYTMAAAAWVLDEREESVLNLTQSGIPTIESWPGDLVVRVVREYLRRKVRGSL